MRDMQQAYVKQVIGLPGDRARLAGGTVVVNGRAIAQTDAGFTRDPGSPEVTVLRRIERRPDGRPYVTFDRGPAHDGDDTAAYVAPEESEVLGVLHNLDPSWTSAELYRSRWVCPQAGRRV
jgi:hypothetical protein